MRKILIVLLFILFAIVSCYFLWNKLYKHDIVKTTEVKKIRIVKEVEAATPSTSFETPIPLLAKKYLPYLSLIIDKEWKDFKPRSIFAGQIEQETCKSLNHPTCWSPKSELKSKVEYGVGLGQITISYDKSGNVRFNNFEGVKKLDIHLKDWEWEDRYNPLFQMEALVTMNRVNYNYMKGWKADHDNKVAFMLSSYNGGIGGLIKDRELCKAKSGCDPNIWFGNVEKYSYKAKLATTYSKSNYQINREYVINIMNTRRFKYIQHLGN
jgi:hypothetical protein